MTKSRLELENKIRSLLFKPLQILTAGSQASGNTWQTALGIKVNNDPGPDWDGIEIKSLIYNEDNRNSGTQLTLSSKSPEWKILEENGISRSSFFHKSSYDYKTIRGSLFFTKRLRYVISEATRSIDWYIVKADCPPTEPYSLVPARIGKPIFTWKIEEALRKVQKLSITYLLKKAEFPNQTITPIKSFIIDSFPDRSLELLLRGSIVYEVRYFPRSEYKNLWDEIVNESARLYPNPNDDSERWKWFDKQFKDRKGKAKDYGVAFRMDRSVLNSILNFGGEILPP